MACAIEVFDGETQGTGTPAPIPTLLSVADPAPSVLGVLQQAEADQLVCEGAPIAKGARVIAVLFSEDISPPRRRTRSARAS